MDSVFQNGVSSVHIGAITTEGRAPLYYVRDRMSGQELSFLGTYT